MGNVQLLWYVQKPPKRTGTLLTWVCTGADDAIILEFKVQDEEEEQELKDTVAHALRQIEEKDY